MSGISAEHAALISELKSWLNCCRLDCRLARNLSCSARLTSPIQEYWMTPSVAQRETSTATNTHDSMACCLFLSTLIGYRGRNVTSQICARSLTDDITRSSVPQISTN